VGTGSCMPVGCLLVDGIECACRPLASCACARHASFKSIGIGYGWDAGRHGEAGTYARYLACTASMACLAGG